MGERKAVHLIFACGALIVAIITMRMFEWIWGYFSDNAPRELYMNGTAFVVATSAAIILYRNQRVLGLTTEIAAELRKVSWPTRKETRMATIVVIITVFISALILGVFDAIWSWATDLLYK